MVCPIGTEQSPVEDLSELPCGHFISLRAWRKWESEKPGEISRCPQCNAEAKDISRTLPMGKIGEIIRGIREECRGIRGLLEQKPNVSSSKSRSPITGVEKEPTPSLIDLVDERAQFVPLPVPMAAQNSASTNAYDEKHSTGHLTPPSVDKPPPYNEVNNQERPPSPTSSIADLRSLYSQSLVDSMGEDIHVIPIKEIKESQNNPSHDSDAGTIRVYQNPSNMSTLNTTPAFKSTESIPKSRTGTPDSSATVQFRRDKVDFISIGSNTTCQATAISATCTLLVLVSSSDFSMYTLSDGGKHEIQHELTCWGSNDGRFGKSKKTATTSLNELNSPRDFKPTYQKAVLSDRVLCIAGRYQGTKNGCIDTHNTKTGHLIASFEFYDRVCWTMEMSPGGEIVAVGTDNGQLSLYRVLPDGSVATWVELTESIKEGSINCIAFNQNSSYMAISTSRSVIRTYYMGGDSPNLVSTFPRNIVSMDPYCGVTGLALYSTIFSSFADIFKFI